MDKKEATAKIAELTAEAKAKVREAQDLADKYGVEFSFSIAYGMGGYYQPQYKEGVSEWNSSDYYESSCYNDDDEDAGWRSSSQSC